MLPLLRMAALPPLATVCDGRPTFAAGVLAGPGLVTAMDACSGPLARGVAVVREGKRALRGASDAVSTRRVPFMARTCTWAHVHMSI